MKYIRTKDGRILEFDKLNEVSKLSIDMAEEPIREADNLFELCDGFYIDDGSGDFKKENIFETILEFENVYHKKRISDTYAIGYGFIKTNKGLIFVAKMNDEGKLCRI